MTRKTTVKHKTTGNFMLDRVLYLLFRRKTGLVLLGAATILFAMAFGGCFTLSMCACGFDKCADACTISCSDQRDCLQGCADACDSCDKEYSCKSGCNVLDCAFGYGYEKDCKNGVIDCGGCNSTCFTDCDNDCSGSTCNGCETCYFSFSNCQYKGNATKIDSYFVKIRIKVVDDSGNEVTAHVYERRIEASEITFKDNVAQTVSLDELNEELVARSFYDYFERALTFDSDNEELTFNRGQYEAIGTLQITVPEKYWSNRYDGSTVEIIAKAHEKDYGNPVNVTVDYSSAGRSNEYFTVNVGSVPAYSAPEIVGYEFVGFFTKDGSVEVPFDPTKAFHAYTYNLSGTEMRLTIYAKYDRKQFKLTIIKTTDGNTGSETSEFDALYNEFTYETLERLKEQEGLGKDTDDAFFRWWAYDADGNKIVDGTERIRESRTIYCRYAKKLTLTLYGIDGKDEGTQAMTVGYGDEIEKQIELPTPANYGRFTFVRWCTDEELTRGVYSGMPITENTALYAEWNEVTEYRIYLYADKASFEAGNYFRDTVFDYTVGTKLPGWDEMKNAIDAPADGYTFVGWKEIDRTDGSDSVVISATISAEFGAKELSPKDYSFVAEFKRSVTLIVSPSFGSFTDGSPTANKEIFLYEGELPVPKSKEDKYVFKGWSQTKDEPYEFVSDSNGTICKPASSARLFAVFGKKEFTLTFTYNDGETNVEQKITVAYGEVPAAPTEPNKVGYAFDGWFDESGNRFDEAATVTANATYTAKFTPKTYTITLIVNGEEFETVEIAYGEKVRLRTPPGYFLRWQDADGKAWTDDSGAMLDGYGVDGNVTLYAKFL